MSGVTISAQGFEVDAEIIARAFGLDSAALREKMRSGAVTSLCEKGIDADEGRFRLTFRHAGRVLQLIVDGEGRILKQATFPGGPNAGARQVPPEVGPRRHQGGTTRSLTPPR